MAQYFEIKRHSTRLLAATIATMLAYLLAITALKPFMIQQTGMMGMMSFANPNYITLNIASLMIGIAAGLAFYIIATPRHDETGKELRIIKKALSEDERAATEQIEKAGEITQDSLRFRLGWSKAKTSTIVSNLERMSLIQRERQGKTYKVFLQKKG